MQRRTLTGSGTTSAQTNGSAKRRLPSWIDSYIESTERLEAPKIFRRWAAICTIAAVVEQRVYTNTGKGPLHPNIYCFLVAYPGVGKTIVIKEAERYYMEMPEPMKAPTSLTGASMVDALKKSKRSVGLPNAPALEYNSMFITADELTAFMHKYDDEVIGIMSAFYDPRHYGQWRRGNDLRIQIKSPQLNVLCGSTPSNLVKLMPESAWEQGFTSRVVMLFSDERQVGDDFAITDTSLNADMVHDLRIISTALGEFKVTEGYRTRVNRWRADGEPPMPTHPKLLHYATRRRVHLYKLSMVSALDTSDVLLLTEKDFDRALRWLTEAEATMPDIFKAGAGNADANAMDEIYHFVLQMCAGGKTVNETRIVNFAKQRVPLHSVERVIDVMTKSGLLVQAGLDRVNKNLKVYRPGIPEGSDSDLII